MMTKNTLSIDTLHLSITEEDVAAAVSDVQAAPTTGENTMGWQNTAKNVIVADQQ